MACIRSWRLTRNEKRLGATVRGAVAHMVQGRGRCAADLDAVWVSVRRWVVPSDLEAVRVLGTAGRHMGTRNRAHFEVLEVKEKMGGLRFYPNGGSDAIFQRIEAAQHNPSIPAKSAGSRGGSGRVLG
jgi:hypothetical protein